jgi:ABC-type transport system involved in cytochrome c biogenesis permease subunit
MPLAVVLFSLTALKGFRTRFSTILVVLMLIVITFCAVGNALLGFPWQGCVQ